MQERFGNEGARLIQEAGAVSCDRINQTTEIERMGRLGLSPSAPNADWIFDESSDSRALLVAAWSEIDRATLIVCRFDLESLAPGDSQVNSVAESGSRLVLQLSRLPSQSTN